MTEIKRETYYSHFGVDSRMRRSAMIDFMQDCCTVSRSNDTVIGPMMKSGEALLYVAYRQLDIVSEPKYREVLTVRTGLFESRRIYGRRTTVILGEGGEVRAKSYLVSTLVHADTRRPINLAKDVSDRLELSPAAEMEFTARKIDIPDTEGVEHPAFRALRCQADTNGHINNARYADLADELIPAGADIKQMRFEYKASFMPGDVIIPTVYETESGYVITFGNAEGAVCAVAEARTKL